MSSERECRQIRLRWMEQFDGGEARLQLSPALSEHLRSCPACREFTTAAEAARSLLGARPLPAPDPAADQALLAALARSEPPAERRQGRLLNFITRFPRTGLRPVLVVGAASFLVTLALGTALSVAPVSSPMATSPRPEPVPTRRAERDLETRLDDWISQPATRPQPRQTPRPDHQRTVPLRPQERSDRSLRSQAA